MRARTKEGSMGARTKEGKGERAAGYTRSQVRSPKGWVRFFVLSSCVLRESPVSGWVGRWISSFVRGTTHMRSDEM